MQNIQLVLNKSLGDKHIPLKQIQRSLPKIIKGVKKYHGISNYCRAMGFYSHGMVSTISTALSRAHVNIKGINRKSYNHSEVGYVRKHLKEIFKGVRKYGSISDYSRKTGVHHQAISKVFLENGITSADYKQSKKVHIELLINKLIGEAYAYRELKKVVDWNPLLKKDIKWSVKHYRKEHE